MANEQEENIGTETVRGKMTAIADAIRGRTGGTEKLSLDQMAQQIAGMQTGGGIGFDVLHTVEITEPVQVVKFDWDTAWNEYKYIYVVPENLVLSTTEWLSFKIWPSYAANVNAIYGQYIGTGGSNGLANLTENQTTLVATLHNGNAYNFRAANAGFSKISNLSEFKVVSFSVYYTQNTMNSGKIHIYGGK